MRLRLDDADDEKAFLSVWSVGQPVIAEGVGERLRERWTPDHLSSLHGELEVPLIDVRSGKVFHRPLQSRPLTNLLQEVRPNTVAFLETCYAATRLQPSPPSPPALSCPRPDVSACAASLQARPRTVFCCSRCRLLSSLYYFARHARLID